MNMIDILEIWAIKNKRNNPAEFFDDVVLDERLDRKILVAEIMRKCGALTPIYNTTDSFEYFTKAFFEREKDVIKKMIDTTMLEYNPLENFERKEKLKHEAIEVTDTDESTSVNESTTVDEQSSSNVSVNNNEENKTSAYNESVYQPETQTTITANTNNAETKDQDTTREVKDKREYDRTRDFNSNDDNVATGINGLTTRQDLIIKQRKVVKFNIYNWIVEKFECEYFLSVY